MLRHFAFAIACLITALAMGGCIFSPKKGDDKVIPPQYLPSDRPENLLANMILAYAKRDSVEYRKALDPAYQGTSTDQTDGTLVTLNYTQEVDHIRALARALTITDVFFNLGPTSSWQRLTSDDPAHPEWAMIQVAGSQFHLVVYDSRPEVGDLTVHDKDEFHIFRFKPTLDMASATDTVWTLVEWEEVLAAEP